MDNKEMPTAPGYSAPLHRSLTQPLYWMGVPRNLLLLEFFTGIIGGILLKTFLVTLLCVAVHLVFRYLGQVENQFHLVFWQNKDYEDYYDP